MKDKPVWERIGLHSQTGYSQKGIIPMKRDIRNDLSYYVEGDYMAEEDTEKQVVFTQENLAGFKIAVHKDQIIKISAPGQEQPTLTVVYDFDNKEDWEDFLEKLWNTEHYMAVKKKDFIEFFQALRYLHGHHCRQMDVVATRQANIQEEINQQQERLDKLKQILSNYEDYYMEVYNENKV